MKHLLKFILYWFKSILRQVIIIPMAFVIYLLRFRRKGRYNVVICEHIGDMVFTLGYLRAFAEKNEINYINVITVQKWVELIELFPNAYDSIQVVKRWEFAILLTLDQCQLGQLLLRKSNDITVVDPGNNFTLGYEFARRFPEANLKDCIKYGILNLEEDAKFETPIRRSEMNESNKAILLCPYATVTNEIDKTIYEDIVKEYTEKGYRLYTNVIGKQSKIEGTEAISYSLKEIYSKGDSFAIIIGVRSGILDLLSFCKCPIVTIYPNANSLVSFFDLNKTNPDNKQIIQYRLTNDLSRDRNEILSILSDLV